MRAIDLMRYSLGTEWERQAYDAFVAPVDDLQLTPEEEKDYAGKAAFATGLIVWETYGHVRYSFQLQAGKLLHPYRRRLSNREEKEAKRRMYVRFMEGRIRFFEYLEKQEHAQLPPIETGEYDFRNTEMAAVFAHLPAQPEVAGWLAAAGISWNDEQLHMVTWFSSQLSLGSGTYSRSRPNHSAKVTYERLLNPYSLLWIAAALGEDRELVLRTLDEMNGYASLRAKCGVVRRAIPWRRIYELAFELVKAERTAQGT